MRYCQKHAMTVGDLKKYLEKIPDEAKVLAEGCDCTGEAFGVEYLPEDNTCEVLRECWKQTMSKEEYYSSASGVSH